MLLTNHHIVSTIDGVMFSAGDSLAAINGIQVLNRWGVNPTLLSGLLTASPLLIREVREHTNVPVFTIEELAHGTKAVDLFMKPRAFASNQ